MTGRPASGAATDDIAGLGRVEQLVLRTDGLTTTSMEVLTGATFTMDVVEHWVLSIHEDDAGEAHVGIDYTGVVPPVVRDDTGRVTELLHLREGDRLLVREVVHRGSDGIRYGAASVAVALDRIPPGVARALAESGLPIGQALRDSGLRLSRRLLSWGLEPAGPRAERLSGGIKRRQPIPARTYVMEADGVDGGIGVFTEWFAPVLFAQQKSRRGLGARGRATRARRPRAHTG